MRESVCVCVCVCECLCACVRAQNKMGHSTEGVSKKSSEGSLTEGRLSYQAPGRLRACICGSHTWHSGKDVHLERSRPRFEPPMGIFLGSVIQVT